MSALLRRWLYLAALIAAGVLVSPAAADDEDGESGERTAPAAAAGKSDLADAQRQLAQRYAKLETLLLKMADLTASSDPRRASLLRRAAAQGKDRDLLGQYEKLVALLTQERLTAGTKSQATIEHELNQLLELLLSEDRSQRIESEKERIRQYLKRVNSLIKEQKGILGEAPHGNAKQLSESQRQTADKTDKLSADVRRTQGPAPDGVPKPGPTQKDQQPPDRKDGEEPGDGKRPDKPPKSPQDQQPGTPGENQQPTPGEPSEQAPGEKQPSDQSPGEKPSEAKNQRPSQGKPQPSQPGDSSEQPGDPSDQSPQDQPPADESPLQQRLRQAEGRMREAQKKLDEAKQNEAQEPQQKAIEQLEQAKAELEKILRQLREEEMARTLALLESRFRKMLALQIDVHEGTKRLDGVPEEQRDRDDEIEAGRLSRKEAEIVADADRALALLAEEASAVAFPEAIRDMRDDMEQVVVQLAQAKVGPVVQKTEEDIIAALEELLAALKQAQKDLEKQKQQRNQPGQPGQPTEPPLVEKLAEIKMIRALQLRVNQRTERFRQMGEANAALQPDAVKAVQRLAERQERIRRVTRDIVVGRNE